MVLSSSGGMPFRELKGARSDVAWGARSRKMGELRSGAWWSRNRELGGSRVGSLGGNVSGAWGAESAAWGSHSGAWCIQPLGSRLYGRAWQAEARSGAAWRSQFTGALGEYVRDCLGGQRPFGSSGDTVREL